MTNDLSKTDPSPPVSGWTFSSSLGMSLALAVAVMAGVFLAGSGG